MKKLTLCLILAVSLSARPQESNPYVPETDPLVLEKLEQWKDLKFGLLMHWGSYSQWGVVESWSICSEDEPWCRRNMKNYVDYCRSYQRLKETFNPVRFNPQKWAQAAKLAGMKYVVFTTKHHDGFCMFDTRETDYRITDSGCPFHVSPKADVTLEIFNAFRAEGFWAGAYFSKPDWHSNDYWAEEWATPDRNVNYSVDKYPRRWDRFCDFTFNQIGELTTRYGKLDILWLDGGWVCRQNGQDIRMPRIVEMARRNQPGLIVVDRAVGGLFENYRTPEQHIPDSLLPYPWETCMTMAGSWSYVPGDTYKPAGQIIHLLADIVSKGGNLLLNIGPGPDGEWHDTAYLRLKEIGGWISVNGEAIYGTRPFRIQGYRNLRFTQCRKSTVYIIYLARENELAMPAGFFVPGFLPAPGTTICLLGGKYPLQWKADGNGFLVEIPADQGLKPPTRYAWAFKVQVNPD